jgi:tetratricopeptide (TPR) repeat protein
MARTPSWRTRAAAALAALTWLACSLSAVGFAQDMNDALSKARSLLKQGKNREAIERLKGLAVKRPEMKGVNRELGLAYYREGEYLDASNYLQRASNENKDDHDVVQLLGLAYYFSGRPIEAIPALERVRSWRFKPNIDAIYVLGMCYAMAARYTEARSVFAEMYGVSPDSAAAHLLIARMLLRQGFDPVAESEARTALSIAPRLPLVHLALGELNIYGGDYLKAVQEFESELAVNPTCAQALAHLGDVYWRLNRDEDSRKALLRSISLNDAATEPYVSLGKALLRQGEISLAEQNLQHAVKLDPGNYTAHYILGQLYRDQGQSEAAKREMTAAARIQQAQRANPGRN